MASLKSSKFYCVKKGRRTGIFTSWSECKEQIHQFSGAIYKSFSNEEEAKDYFSEENFTENFQREKEEIKLSSIYPLSSFSSFGTKEIIAYTDGSCDINRTKTAGASCIILFEDEVKCIMGKKEENSTNNRGELFGILLALKYFSNLGDKENYKEIYKENYKEIYKFKIITDSNYAINQSTKNWKANCNLDILNEIWSLLDSINVNNVKVSFQWVKGHNKDKYNEMADMYANRARKLNTNEAYF
jgi:ribonuclease HI